MKASLSAAVLLLGFGPSIFAQSTSPITDFLAPWGGYGNRPVAMTPDGQWVAFADRLGTGCFPGFDTVQRIALIRSDGTGYRVVVDSDTIEGLEAKDHDPRIDILTMSGDAGTLYFRLPHEQDPSTCFPLSPLRHFLVDVATGTITEPIIGGQPILLVSFTDDGSKMAFAAYNASLQVWGWWTANTDGTGAQMFAVPPAGYEIRRGVISGDGSRFAHVVFQNLYPFPSDVYLYDFATGSDTKLNPTTEDSIQGVSLSSDGSRVVYSNGPIYAVQADGSEYHVLPGTGPGVADHVTLTRNGELIFYTGFGKNYRVNWDGTGLEEIGGFGGGFTSQLPVNWDGSLYAWESGPWPDLPVAVTSFQVPWLWSYGYETPGSTMTFDVGGDPGDAYYLAGSLTTGTFDVPPFGTAGLDPASLVLLGSGTVETGGPLYPPFDVGTTTATIPSSPGLAGLTVHFQALVIEGPGLGAFTNVTTVLIHD